MSDPGCICQMSYPDYIKYFSDSFPPPPASSPCFGLWEIWAGTNKAWQCAIANGPTIEAREMAAANSEAAWKAYHACHGSGGVQASYSIKVTPASGSVSCGHPQTFAAKLYLGANLVAPQPVFKFNVSAGITCAPVTGTSTTVSAVPSYSGNTTLKVSTPTGLSVNVPVAVTTSPPSLVSAPTAVPNPVIAKQTHLHAVARDACGAGLLLYAWSRAAGPAQVAIVPNMGPAASSPVATFKRAGTYQIEVRVTNSSGYAATGYVTVVVEQTATTLEVLPGMDVVGTGSSATFTAQELDQFGNPMTVSTPVNWSVTGALNSVAPQSGLSTVATTGSAPGTYVITAETGALTATATLVVIVQPIITSVVPDDFTFCRSTDEVVKIIGKNFTPVCSVLLTRPDLTQFSAPAQASLAGGTEIDLATSLDMVGVWGAVVTNSDGVSSPKFNFYIALRVAWDPYSFYHAGGIVQNTNPLTQLVSFNENDGQQPALAPLVVDGVTITPYAYAEIDKPAVAPFNGQISLTSVANTSTDQLLNPNVVLSQSTFRSFQIKSDGLISITGTVFQPDGGNCGCSIDQPGNNYFTTDTLVGTPVPGGTLKTVNVSLPITTGCWRLVGYCDLNAGTPSGSVSLKFSIIS